MPLDGLSEHKFFSGRRDGCSSCEWSRRRHLGGTYYLLIMVDANRNTVALAWAHFADNENDPTWLSFMEWVKLIRNNINCYLFSVLRKGSLLLFTLGPGG